MNDLNDNLTERLRRLGDHIDAERVAAGSASSSATGDRSRWFALAAAAVLVIGGIVGITVWRTNRHDDMTVPATIAPPTTAVGLPATSTPAADPSTTAPAGPLGTMTVVLRVQGSPTSQDVDNTVRALQSLTSSMESQPTVLALLNQPPDIEVTFIKITHHDADIAARSLLAVGAQLHIRPVVAACTAAPANVAEHTRPRAGETATLTIYQSSPLGQCTVGPTAVTADAFETKGGAQPGEAGGWTVDLTFKPGAAGEDVFNALATQCYQRDVGCPTGQIAFELDGSLLSVATVQTPMFSGTLQVSFLHSRAMAEILLNSVTQPADPNTPQVAIVTTRWTH
jgi:hypothetical protein